VYGVVEFECISIFIHQEDTWYISLSKWIMVAISGQLTSVQLLEITLFCIDRVARMSNTNLFISRLSGLV
jgi:hypothetical protein